jgi:hypothetical protein
MWGDDGTHQRAICVDGSPTRERDRTCEDDGSDDRAGHHTTLRLRSWGLLVRRDDLVHTLVGDTEFVRDLPQRQAGTVQLHDLSVVGVTQPCCLIEGTLVLVAELLDLLEVVLGC